MTRIEIIETLFNRGHYCAASRMLHQPIAADCILAELIMRDGGYPDLHDFTNPEVYTYWVQDVGPYEQTPTECRVEVERYLQSK